MKNKKSKISFDRNELEQFLNNSELVIKANTLSRIQGGEPSYEQRIYANENYYSKTTFVNSIYANRIG